MNTPLKLAGFGLGLVAALGVGTAVGPVGTAAEAPADAHAIDEADWVAATSGPHVRFATTAPSAGDYRLFLDFEPDGVRTASFTVAAGAQEEEHG